MTELPGRSKPPLSVPPSGATIRLAESATVDFRQLFDREFDYVLRTLRFLGVHSADLEDVAHDVFLHVFRHLNDYDPSRPIRPWLYAFAFRIARDFRTAARHRVTFTDDFSDCIAKGAHPEAQLIRQQVQAMALRALDALDNDERGVFVASALDELTAPQIAEALRIPINTVYSRLRRARTKFEAESRRLSAKERLR